MSKADCKCPDLLRAAKSSRLGLGRDAGWLGRMHFLFISMLVCPFGFQECGWAAYTKDRLSLTPVVAGSLHSFALEDGKIWGWGYDGDGRLGTGLPQAYTRLNPESVVGLDGVAALAAGSKHTLAQQTNGTLWSWGQNSFGQLGTGTHAATNAPAPVQSVSNIVALAAGFGHSLALDATGHVWGWGRNSYGQLGLADLSDVLLPIQVPALSNITVICAGENHSLAMDGSGTVWAWGANGYGQLGLGTYSTVQTNPAAVIGLPSIKQMCAGAEHSLALDTNGHVWAWGRDISGQLGEGATWSDSNVPILVTSLSNIVTIAAGLKHNLAADAQGAVWAWGCNSAGQLGDATTKDRFVPMLLTNVTEEIVTLAAGSEHSLAVTRHGQVLGWGNNSDGRLGNGAPTGNSNPVAPVTAIFHHHYQVLVVMLSRYDVGTNYSSIVVDMNRLVADISRYSYGKVAVSYDLAGPFLADPIADIGCSGGVNDPTKIREYAFAVASTNGIDVSHYAHVIIEVHENLLYPNCITTQNGEVLSGGPFDKTGVTILTPGAFFNVEGNRHIIAHEFLHGYGNCLVPHVELVDCGCNAAYQPDANPVGLSPFCTRDQFDCAMDIMALPAAAYNTDTGPNVNGIYKETFGWLSSSAIVTVTNSGSFDLYPVDDPELINGHVYLLKLPVLGVTPSGVPQQLALEYRKQASIGIPPGTNIYRGVFPFLSERNLGCDVPFAFILRTQPRDPNTRDGITPLSTNLPTMLQPAGLVVQVTSLNESYARVNVDFNGIIRPVLRDFLCTDEGTSFSICGVRSGAVVAVERASSLPPILWETVTNFVSDGHSTHWSKLLNTNQPSAYYRVRVQTP